MPLIFLWSAAFVVMCCGLCPRSNNRFLSTQKLGVANEYTPLDVTYRINSSTVRSILDSDSVSKFREFTIVSKCGIESKFTPKGNNEIYLQDTKSGWGDGRHPTTNLCLRFVHDNVMNGDILMGNKYSCIVRFMEQIY